LKNCIQAFDDIYLLASQLLLALLAALIAIHSLCYDFQKCLQNLIQLLIVLISTIYIYRVRQKILPPKVF